MHYKATIILAAAGVATASTVLPIKRALPTNWAAAGCYTDSWTRTLPNQVTVSGSFTNEKCAAACNAAGYSISGSEAGSECWCGNTINESLKSADGDCSTTCPGASAQKCGGGWRLTVSKKSTASGGSSSTYTPPNNWSSAGCYSDSWSRTLPTQAWPSGSMSMTGCINSCAASGFSYAGVENGNECWCGGAPGSTLKAADGDCATKCSDGSPGGGGWRLSVYKKAATPYTPPSGWAAAGCYQDSASRSLTKYSSGSDSSMTMTKCINTCASKGYKLAGTEAGTECYCDNNVSSSLKAGDGECATPCAADASQTCGGGWRLSVFQNANSSGGSGGSTTTTTSPTSTPTPPTGSTDYPGKSSGWTQEGCYQDSASRTLTQTGGAPGKIETCQASCNTMGYKYAGLEAGTECWCGDSLPSNMKASTGDCATPCANDSGNICGGGWRLSVYSKPPPTSGPSTFERVGCFKDSSSARFLREYTPSLGNSNTPQNCIAACAAKGYGYAGVEYGAECYCGNQLWNVVNLDDGQCNIMKCPGDSSQYCGNGNAIMLYQDTIGWCS